MKDERKTRVLATTARTFLCVVREQSEPVFINRSKPLFFLLPLFYLFISVKNFNAREKRKKEKKTIKEARALDPMEAPAMDDLGKADDRLTILF